MSKIRQLIANEYANAYDLKTKPDYSKPAIYNAKGNLSVRWYVYYSFRNPKTYKLERQTPLYEDVNRFKTFKTRTAAIRILRDAVEEILANGYNPFTDESDAKIQDVSEIVEYSIADGFELVRTLKESEMEKTSFTDFKSRINQFERWLIANDFEGKTVNQITKKTVINYLNAVQLKSSPKNRNNTRVAISTLFTVLEDNEAVQANFIDKINVVSAKPVRNKSYTLELEEKLLKEVEETQPMLDIFIKFVCFAILRPIEICRLRIEDVDPIGKKIYVKTKNKPVKIKIIPQILLSQLPDLSRFDKKNSLITPNGLGEIWEAEDENKRTHFTKQFKTVKDKFGLGKEYGMYSFRHTIITRLYKNLLIGSTPDEAESKLMLITGHATRKALHAYLRDIDAVLPEDFSKHFDK